MVQPIRNRLVGCADVHDGTTAPCIYWTVAASGGSHTVLQEVVAMHVFGHYTQWAVVFLIIFVLFFLFVPDRV